MKLSICIPTHNRAANLNNCLHSIISNKPSTDFEVCVSDNGSTAETDNVVLSAQQGIAIKYRKNSSNLGIPRNFLNVVEMASGEFVWLIGDDDLLLPDAIDRLLELIDKHPKVDFFYVNAFYFDAQHVFSCPQPFDTSNLPKNMGSFSSWPESSEMKFLDLIDPGISFDFLGGMFLSVFRREKWISNVHAISQTAFSDTRLFSNFDNTFPHVKIFAQAFAKSRAFFCAEPLSVSLTGAREWVPMYRMVRSVRLVEALGEYRRHGLPYLRYLRCKNFALRTFIPDLVYMLIKKPTSGFEYLSPMKLVRSNFLFPNFYFSPFYILFLKIKYILTKFFQDLKNNGRA